MCLTLTAWAGAGCSGPGAVSGTPLAIPVERAAWHSPHFDGQELTSQHYRIYTTSDSPALRAHLPGFMEAACQNHLALTGLEDRRWAPMPIYMLRSRDEWADLTRTLVGREADAYLSIEAGGYCCRGVCVFWDMRGEGTFRVAAHEAMHQFLHHRLAHNLPVWAEEGLCVAAEGHRIHRDAVTFDPRDNAGRLGDLREALAGGRWIGLARLLAMDGAQAVAGGSGGAGYYGQLWALVLLVRSRPAYRTGLERMLSDAQAGNFHKVLGVPPHAVRELQLRGRIYNQTVSRALFEHYVSRDLAKFEEEYAAFARKMVRLE